MPHSGMVGVPPQKPSSEHARARRRGLCKRSILRWPRGANAHEVPAQSRTDDTLLVEAPLEIRWAGDRLFITMRTPGEDRFLTLGLLLAEGIISGLHDVGTISHCGRVDDEAYGNVIDVLPGPGAVVSPDTAAIADALALSRRGTLMTSSCGVCGRQTIEDLLARIEPVTREPRVAADLAAALPALFKRAQPRFAASGAAHQALMLDEAGQVLASAEDVGRHNAVDKAVGKLLLEEALPAATLLAVSGRVSFEIVQKAASAGIPMVAGLSATTSLAVDLAEQAGITLLAFVRDGGFNVYSHERRID